MSQRRRIRVLCRGAVQGVGFRPTVFRLADQMGLSGTVCNDGNGATVEVEGPERLISGFPDRLRTSLPPLARLDELTVEAIPVTGVEGFQVTESTVESLSGALVPPDASLCDECRADMERADDRRFRYPFTTCTNCGPRYSLVAELPYDRQRTSMACFPLCVACAAEYRDPGDRRYHAEPVCCPDCGPRLWLTDATGHEMASGSAAVEAARQALIDGRIVAIKGLGGFQLACRADDRAVVAVLRNRKHRPRKPFAVMVRSLAEARATVELGPAEESLLASSRAPIVLAPRKPGTSVASDVAPDLDDLGLLLPTTPLHVELFRDGRLPALVMTSGNTSDEPICCANREAVERLADQADLLLLHDRDILRRVDDSVVRSGRPEPFIIRRARGWVPEPMNLEAPAAEPLLAVGGHLQVAACIARDRQAFLAPHVGDLDTEKARAFLLESIEAMESFLQVEASLVVADAHPDYPSRWLAEDLVNKRGGQLIPVQHHLAHAAAVLAEFNAWPSEGNPAVVMVFDGTGWGPDGTAWGGEWLEIDSDLVWKRRAHLEPLPLVGGERAVREPWRVAAAALARAGAEDLLESTPLAGLIEPDKLRMVADLSNGRWATASGAGRLFEACGALLGLTAVNTFEGEAAARVEATAAVSGSVPPWPEVEPTSSGDLLLLPSSGLLAAAARKVVGGEPINRVAAGFHATFCHLAARITASIAATDQIIATAGGCLVNRLLREGLKRELESTGRQVLLPTTVPPGDGGLSWGQTAVAVTALDRGVDLETLVRPTES